MKARLTAQPHIWPGRNLGLRFDVTEAHVIITSAVCLDCDWSSPWAWAMKRTHDDGDAHDCAVPVLPFPGETPAPR